MTLHHHLRRLPPRRLLFLALSLAAFGVCILGGVAHYRKASWGNPWPVSRSNILALILCLAAAATTVHVYYEREKSYGPTSQEFLISFLLNKADSAGIHYQPAIFISNTTQVTYHPIHYYCEYFFPLWQTSILPVDSLKLDHPEQSQPLVIITDTEIAHTNLLPTWWTGTTEMTYLDPDRQRFPVRYGLYRYSR